MRLELTFGDEAERDLQERLTWITEQAGREVARAYIGRIRAACETLLDRPNGGTPQRKWGEKFRSVSFERAYHHLQREWVVPSD